ncbi:MAG: helix-turn-helix transcriptional regulator [Nanobdellota archaeon]
MNNQFRRACMLFLIFFILIVSNHSVLAARVHGTIYDQDLEPLSKVVVVANSSPMQRHISKYGGYSFELSEGKYRINATINFNDERKTIASEIVNIKSKEGDYNIDLFVYPGTNLSEFFGEVESENNEFFWILGMLIISFIAVIMLFSGTVYIAYKKKLNSSVKYNIEYESNSNDNNVTMEQEDNDVKRNTNISINSEENDPLKNKIISFLKENDKITQKDIRRKIPLSESKISSTLSQLTKDGIIEKYKKGRVNYILLKKKS